MKSCKEMKNLRNNNYKELLSYIELKILTNLTKGYIRIDEDETEDKNVKFKDGRWVGLLEEAGYKVEYCNNYVTPTVKISGW